MSANLRAAERGYARSLEINESRDKAFLLSYERRRHYDIASRILCTTFSNPSPVVNDGNGENEERVSKKLSGEEDSNAVLFPRPLLLLGDTTKV